MSGIDNAIEVRAPNVTIDLNGFTVTSSTLFGAAQRGIFIAAGVPDAVIGGTLTVKNGTLTGFTSSAIGTFDTDDSLILRDVVLKENGAGVSSTGDCDARGCLFIRNTGSGIVAGRGSVVRECRAIDNGFIGINVFGGAVIDCVVRGSGVDGISLGKTDDGASVARNNVVNTSGEFGISCLNAIIEGNAIAQNTRGGIRTETTQGFAADSDGVIARNFLRANGLQFDQGAIEINAGHYRVDENTIADANVGVLVRGGAADKVITRNTIDNTSFPISVNTLGNVSGFLDSDYANDRVWQNLEQ